MKIQLSAGWQPDERSAHVQILSQMIETAWTSVPTVGATIVWGNGDHDGTVESLSWDADTGIVDLYLGRWKAVNGDTLERLAEMGFTGKAG